MRGKLEAGYYKTGQLENRPHEMEAGQAGNFSGQLESRTSWNFFKKNIPF